MGKTLILTEKPSVARDFAQALGISARGEGFFEGEGVIITWALGHLLELAAPEDYDPAWKRWSLKNLPIIPAEFKRHPVDKTAAQFRQVMKQMKRADVASLIVATDAGREGELIARTLVEAANFKKATWRFWSSEALDAQVIKRELKKIRPLSAYDPLYKASLGRQLSDWLVGMNFTRAATVLWGELYSIGRVQTTVLALIVKRHWEREKFVPQAFYKLKAQFKTASAQYQGEWFDPQKKEHKERITEATFAQALSKKLDQGEGHIAQLKQEEKVWPSPLLFSLTELQREANICFHLSAKDTLSLAQNLYEKYKCLSYPRTDSSVLGESNVDLAKSLLQHFAPLYPEAPIAWWKASLKNKRLFNNQKLTDHHGLIPLKEVPAYASTQEKKIFDLVLKRFLAAFSEDCRYQKTEVITVVLGEHFKSVGKIYTQAGHRALYPQDDLKDIVLPKLTLGEKAQIEKLQGEAHETTPPPVYTEASLLEAMSHPARFVEEKKLKEIFQKEVGLGTQATRAQMIETLLERQYIERQDKKLLPLPKGIFLVGKLNQMPHLEEMLSPKKTAEWEERLEAIAQGEGDSAEFLRSICSFVQKAVSVFHKETPVASRVQGNSAAVHTAPLGPCPGCQGDVFEHKSFYSCALFLEKKCAFVVWKQMAKKFITAEIVRELLNKKKTKKISGFKSAQGKSFSASLKLNPKQDEKFKVIFEFAQKKWPGPSKKKINKVRRVASGSAVKKKAPLPWREVNAL